MTRRMIRLAHDPGDSQITSHCPFCGSGQVVGRSDGNIECEFCGMTYLVRIQPMFTGMPQQPMPPGAGFGGDTSMATDLMAPGMVGPDGLPLEPGVSDPILAEEEGAGGVPFGGEDEEGEFGGVPESGPAETEGSDGGFPPEEGEEGFPPGEEGEEGPGGEGDDGAPPWVKDKGSSPEDSGDKGKGDKKDKPKGKKGGDKKPPPFKKKSAQQQVQRTIRPQRSRYETDEIPGSSGGVCSCKGCESHPGRQCYAQVLQAGNQCYACRKNNQARNNVQAEAVRAIAARHEDMSSAELRHHMREQHGFSDSPDDPDWLIDNTHRQEHADDPYHSHQHQDFEDEQADFGSADREWLGGHGITGRRYRTVAGDLLPEDAYIRHLAALHGGVEVLRRPA